MNAEKKSPDYILGIEREIIEDFLILIRDKYPVVDKANFFLEIHGGLGGASIAMANQRDFLSHLCTVLKDESLEYQKKYAQVSAAEEHFRRAVIECYQKGVESKLVGALELYVRYKEEVIPYKKIHADLSPAPDIADIRKDLDEIDELRQKGRKAKTRNNWDDEWEEGVDAYLKAFLKIKKLHEVLEDFLTKTSQIEKEHPEKIPEKPNKKFSWVFLSISIIINIILFAILFIGN